MEEMQFFIISFIIEKLRLIR